jgi:cytoskeletal protein CcmA (bactofilin family)
VNATDETVIAQGSDVSGRVIVANLALLGRFKGRVQAEGAVRIGADAQVEAQVQASSVQVSGQFEGQIRARVLSFAHGARAKGSFFCERLLLNDGAVVDGAFNLDPPAEEPAVEAAPKAASAPAKPAAAPAKAAAAATAPVDDVEDEDVEDEEEDEVAAKPAR